MSKRIKLQGKIDSLKSNFIRYASVAPLSKETIDAFISKYPVFKEMRDQDKQQFRKIKNEITKLQRQVIELDSKIQYHTPASRVSNIKSKLRGGLKLAGLTLVAYAGIKVIAMAGATHDTLVLKANESMSLIKYYTMLKEIHQGLSDLHKELLQN